MATQLYAVIAPGGSVINLVEWDGLAPFNVAPNTLQLAQGNPAAQIGGTFAGGVFTPPAPVPSQGVLFTAAPVSGATVILPNAPQPQGKLYAVLTPAGVLAALSVNLPPAPSDGDDLYVLSTQAITTLTPVYAPGQGKINIPASFTLASGVSQHIIWSAQINSWFRL